MIKYNAKFISCKGRLSRVPKIRGKLKALSILGYKEGTASERREIKNLYHQKLFNASSGYDRLSILYQFYPSKEILMH